MRFRRRFGFLTGFGKRSDCLVHRFFLHRHFVPIEADRLEVHDLKIGQDFQRHGVFQIAAVLIVANFDFRLHRRLEILIVQCLRDAFLERLLQHLAQHGFAQPHLQDRERRLAPAETGNLQFLADFGQLAGDLAVDIRRRDGYPVFAFQAFGRRFRHLHGSAIPIFRSGRSRGPDCSTPFDPDGRMVRAEGLEPPRLSSLAPKASASTNSATPAPARKRPDAPGRAVTGRRRAGSV